MEKYYLFHPLNRPAVTPSQPLCRFFPSLSRSLLLAESRLGPCEKARMAFSAPSQCPAGSQKLTIVVNLTLADDRVPAERLELGVEPAVVN